MAGSGFRRKYAGCLAATASRHKSSRAFLGQASEKTKLCTTGHRHGQIEELRSSKETSDAECRTSTAQEIEQPGRKFTSTHQSTRTTNNATLAKIDQQRPRKYCRYKSQVIITWLPANLTSPILYNLNALTCSSSTGSVALRTCSNASLSSG